MTRPYKQYIALQYLVHPFCSSILFIHFVHCFCLSILFINFICLIAQEVSRVASIKTLTYGQNPVGKRSNLGRKRVSTILFIDFVHQFYLSIGSKFICLTKFLKVGPLSALVSISASCSFVLIWLSCIVLFVTCSRTKWYCISIYLVLA